VKKKKKNPLKKKKSTWGRKRGGKGNQRLIEASAYGKDEE